MDGMGSSWQDVSEDGLLFSGKGMLC